MDARWSPHALIVLPVAVSPRAVRVRKICKPATLPVAQGPDLPAAWERADSKASKDLAHCDYGVMGEPLPVLAEAPVAGLEGPPARIIGALFGML